MHINDLIANRMSVTTIYAGAMASRPHQRLAYLQDKEWFLTELTPIYSLQVTMNPMLWLRQSWSYVCVHINEVMKLSNTNAQLILPTAHVCRSGRLSIHGELGSGHIYGYKFCDKPAKHILLHKKSVKPSIRNADCAWESSQTMHMMEKEMDAICQITRNLQWWRDQKPQFLGRFYTCYD